jgi:hypothetical protein
MESGAGAGSSSSTGGGGGGGGGPQQPNRSRCLTCKKKVGLTGFECKCGFVFCGAHRHADQHACTFDFKAHGRGILEKLNPTVVASKVESI